MTFRKADIIFVALALLVVGGVALLPSPRDRNPKVPVNRVHQAVTRGEGLPDVPRADRRPPIARATSQAARLSALSRARAELMKQGSGITMTDALKVRVMLNTEKTRTETQWLKC